MRVESRARARVLQALYAWDMRDDQPLDRVATTIWDDLAIPPLERAFAGRLIRVVIAREQELEQLIENVTTNWRIERIGAIERSVLRLAAAELSAGETPPRVVIQEAVRRRGHVSTGSTSTVSAPATLSRCSRTRITVDISPRPRTTC